MISSIDSYIKNSGFSGITSAPIQLSSNNKKDENFYLYSCSLGNLTLIDNNIRGWNGKPLTLSGISGAGSDVDKDYSIKKSFYEAMERYASCIAFPEEYIVASGYELGEAAVDVSIFPKPSPTELKNSKITRPYNRHSPIRWIKCLDVFSDSIKYIPLCYTHLYPKAWSSERFFWPISTGAAIHTSYSQAILKAVLEVVERDSIALTWLLKRNLKKISFDDKCQAEFDCANWERLNDPEFNFFNATTDLGIPTVYLNRKRPNHPTASNLITCATDLVLTDAIKNASRESTSTNYMFDTGFVKVPDSADKCISIEDGASFMGQKKHDFHFDFLETSEFEDFSELSKRISIFDHEKRRLNLVLDRLRINNLSLFLIDQTTDELRKFGLIAIKAVIPELMPMSTVHECRYLGHARLYDFAKKIGLKSFSEKDVNKMPQPFA